MSSAKCRPFCSSLNVLTEINGTYPRSKTLLRHGVSNHRQFDLMFNSLFRYNNKERTKLCTTSPLLLIHVPITKDQKCENRFLYFDDNMNSRRHPHPQPTEVEEYLVFFLWIFSHVLAPSLDEQFKPPLLPNPPPPPPLPLPRQKRWTTLLSWEIGNLENGFYIYIVALSHQLATKISGNMFQISIPYFIIWKIILLKENISISPHVKDFSENFCWSKCPLFPEYWERGSSGHTGIPEKCWWIIRKYAQQNSAKYNIRQATGLDA